VVAEADASVQRTPDLLPVLKEAGVVDSGGKGLFIILEGMLRLIYGQPLDQAEVAVKPLSAISLENSVDAIEPGQDYEVVIDFQPHMPLNLTSFYGRLEEMGTSIQVGEGEGIYRLHIHVPTDNRYLPIDYTMSLGVVTRVAIENLMAQMEAIETQCQDAPYTLAPVMPGQIAVVAISPGAGLSRVFASLGAAAIVEGGQTMNPSTQEIIAAFEDLPTDQIVILPNNKNIIMTAKAAAELTVKKVAVIPTKSVPQGLAAMLRLDANGSFESVVADMEAAIDTIQTGEITTAIRSVEIDGVEVAEGQIIALHNGKLVLAATDLENAILDLLMQAQVEDYELVTLFYGTNIAKSEVIRLAEVVRAAYPRQEIEVQEGCQPHYQFIISIE
jgi:DAK2 domain fusion protein YloV